MSPSSKKIGRYEVLDTLGQGGMGIVYLAYDPVLGRKVAVKMILASNFAIEDQDDLLRRLLKEGQAAANMRHPGIVTVFDAMQQGDETYIVMEYVAGCKLSDLLKERPDHETTLRILREIAEAVDYAHEHGIVHRDIKPDNILLDSAGKVRITDFGIAKSVSRHSITNGAMGTPHYMSPEQIRNEDEIDGKADQFSLGVIAYTMLTGRKPFEGKSQLAIGQKIVGVDPPRASKVEKSLPPEVDAVLLRALAKSPAGRYPTCVAFVEDLQRGIEGSPVQARGGSRRWLVGAAIALVAVAGGFSASRFLPALFPSDVHYKLSVYLRNTPIEPGQQLLSGGPSAPEPGDLSAAVTADSSVPSSLNLELTLLANGKAIESAVLRPDAAGMQRTFTTALPPGDYDVRLKVGAVEKGKLSFVVAPPAEPPPFGLVVRVMGNIVTEGQRINKSSPGYPKAGFIGPTDVTATVVPKGVPLIGLRAPAKLEWFKNGTPVAPPAALTADDLGKPIPLSTGPSVLAEGEYTAKLTADGRESFADFTLAGADAFDGRRGTSQPKNSAGPGDTAVSTPRPALMPRPKTSRGLWVLIGTTAIISLFALIVMALRRTMMEAPSPLSNATATQSPRIGKVLRNHESSVDDEVRDVTEDDFAIDSKEDEIIRPRPAGGVPTEQTADDLHSDGGPSASFTQFLGGSDGSSPRSRAFVSILSCPDPILTGQAIPITGFPFPLGRGNRGLAIASDQTLSREHAVINWDGRSFSICDLSSTNGTFLEGQRLVPSREEPLWFGAEIRLSRNTTLRFAADVSELPEFTGQTLSDRYLIKKLIRSNRKVAVYEAQDTKPPRAVAIKLLSPSLASFPGYLDQFEREAHTAAQLSHPNICKILEYGSGTLRFGPTESKVLSYICMPMLDGGNLADRLDDTERTKASQVAGWLEVIAGALDEAHRAGVVHAGLKPTSIVFSAANVPYVTDFAIAVRISDRNRPPLLGDPNYLSPEQWDGLVPTASTDQYSLAVLVFRCLTGGLPHIDQRDPDKRAMNFSQGPSPPGVVAKYHGRDEIPEVISQVLKRALSVNPDHRYPTIVEFALAFREALQTSSAGTDRKRHRIFISYHRETHSGWAVLIGKTMRERHGIEAFVDTQRVDRAGEVPAKIEAAIKECTFFVCLLGKNTLKSAWVMEEIRMAVEANKPMIPLMYEDFKRPRLGSAHVNVEKLINYEGVRVFADFDDAAMEKLARIIRSQT